MSHILCIDLKIIILQSELYKKSKAGEGGEICLICCDR